MDNRVVRLRLVQEHRFRETGVGEQAEEFVVVTCHDEAADAALLHCMQRLA